MKFLINVVGFLSALIPVYARAEAVRLDYAAGPECPDNMSFRASIEERARRDVTWVQTNYSLLLDVRIHVERDRAVGVFRSSDTGGVQPPRSVDGANCQTVADALALIAALTIYPATSEPREPKPKEAKRLTSPSNTGKTENDTKASVDAERKRKPWIVRVGVGTGIVSGIAPEMLIPAALPIVLEAPRNGIWSPEFGLMPMTAETGVIGSQSNAGTFSWLALRTEGCPLSLPLLSELFLTPCATFDFGTVHAGGADIGTPIESRRIWAALGAGAHLRWAGASFFADLGAALLAPLVRTSYMVVSPNTGARYLLHENADVTAAVLLAAGLRFQDP